MQKFLYAIIICCFFTLFILQCKYKDKNAAVEVQQFNRDSIKANDTTLRKIDSLSGIPQEEDLHKEITSIKFDKEAYDFGECTEGDKVVKTIEFTNTGKLPLVIKNAFGSCGCTVPTFDKEPIAPGEKGKIEIVFDSTRKPGSNTKSVMIEANTNPPVTTINFSVKVNSKSKKN